MREGGSLYFAHEDPFAILGIRADAGGGGGGGGGESVVLLTEQEI